MVYPSAAKLPPGAERPLEIVTGLFDQRILAESLAGAFNNTHAFLGHLATKGIELGEIDPHGSLFDDEFLELFDDLLAKPDISLEHDRWFLDLAKVGFTRLFGYRALRDSSRIHRPYDNRKANSVPVLSYVGDLPSVLQDKTTVEALQERLNIRWNKNILIGPTSITALYEDMSVGLHPMAHTRTTNAELREIWQIEIGVALKGGVTVEVPTLSLGVD